MSPHACMHDPAMKKPAPEGVDAAWSPSPSPRDALVLEDVEGVSAASPHRSLSPQWFGVWGSSAVSLHDLEHQQQHGPDEEAVSPSISMAAQMHRPPDSPHLPQTPAQGQGQGQGRGGVPACGCVGVRRVLLLGCCVLLTLLAGGIVFGWNGLLLLLQREGYYNHLCQGVDSKVGTPNLLPPLQEYVCAPESVCECFCVVPAMPVRDMGGDYVCWFLYVCVLVCL